MKRERNTTVTGDAFDEEIIEVVWEKAAIIEDKDPAEYWCDIFGNEVCRESFSKQSIMGWEIDHIKPVAKGGTDELSNLQVLQSKANAIKGDNYPWP